MSCVIGTYNLIDSATLSGGSWVSTLPRSNLQTKLIGQVARTSDDAEANTTFTIDHGSAKEVQIVALVNHNISSSGTVRIRGGSDATFATCTYDSGIVNVWASVYDSDLLEWEDANWWLGQYSEEELEGYTPQFIQLLETSQTLRYWRVDISDTSNLSGFVDVGRVFIGPAWIPERDAEIGLTVSWESASQTQTGLSGTKYFTRRNPYRVTNISFNVMDTEEALLEAFEIDSRIGINEEVFWIQDSDDTLHALRRRYLANIKELTPIEFYSTNLTRKAYTLEEVV